MPGVAAQRLMELEVGGVISNAHEGLTTAVTKVLRAAWQRCRVDFVRNAPAHAGKAQRRIDLVGIFPNEAAVVRLVSVTLLAQSDGWTTQRSRYMTLEACSTASDPATVRLSAAST